jgi:drug/metabolite transporter (DMT)-like permease
MHNGFFIAAVVLYAALAIMWVWVLSFTSLSRAYPFVAIAFAITPLLGGLVFGEALPPRLFVGLLLISCGLFFIIG